MRVGTSLFPFVTPPCIRDHPHACGDKRLNASEALKDIGSSPCVWGQDKWKKEAQTSDRIIPMRVGTSVACGHILTLAGDHPHACGDK